MRKLLIIVATLALQCAAACTVHNTTAPSPSGPSTSALSIALFANPDHVPQDGLHPSTLSVKAFDAGGHPIAAQVHLVVAQPASFGTLSTDINGNLVTTTDDSHPALVSYLPPASTTGVNTTVTIFASIVGADSVTASTNQISLVAQPAIAIASTAPTAVMTLNPSAQTYATNETIVFDGTTSCGGGLDAGVCSNTSAITSYVWNFGDNTTRTGSSVSHFYAAANTYQVTLTITNDKNLQASTTRTMIVDVVAAPTAAFTVSPTPVTRGAAINFNASTSTVATGHTIASYAWNFGDGTTATSTSPTQTHVFTTAGTYTVTLTVTDDVGQTKITSSTVTVT